MKRQIIRLTEEDLHNIVMNTVRLYLSEGKHSHKSRRHPKYLDISEYVGDDMGDPMMGDMGDPSMGGDPSMQDPSMGADPMGGDPSAMGEDPSMQDPSMDGGDPSMDGGDPNAMGGDPNAMGGGDPKREALKQQIDALPDADLKAAEGYIESLGRDNGDDADPNAMGGGDPMQQMQESFMREMSIALEPRQGKRQKKEITNNKRKSPWIF